MGSNLLMQFKNCRILRNHQLITEDIWVRNGKIINPEKVFFDEKVKADRQINCQGSIIAPGFIELQINGAFGVDFSYNANVEEGINLVAKGLLSHGVTSFCPTIVTSPKNVYHKVLPLIKRRAGDANGATILGIHVEGPFINVEKKGAHPPECIKGFDGGFTSVMDMYGGVLEHIAVVTLAPELKNANDVIKELSSRNIVVSVGHSMADLCDGEEAVKNGASLITHLFNAMLPFHHRDPGLVGLLTSDAIPPGKTVYFGIIADGIHTHPAALRIAHRAHPKGLILVTDAISAMGLAEGRHRIGQFEMEVRDGKAYVAGTNTLCGSIATMIECVRLFQKVTGCTIEYALETATLHPASVLGISHQKGTLNFGADADFIMLNDNLEVQSTWIAGDCVYRTMPVKSIAIKNI